MGRPAAMTKIGEKKVTEVRGRGNNTKFRALRLETGNFSWGTEVVAKKVRILDVNYNASNNELVRTKTLVKGAIVLIDAHPFKLWYENHFGKKIGVKGGKGKVDEATEKKSDRIERKQKKRCQNHSVEQALDDQFASGRLYAKITSRPGQSGRADGYILEGKELDFYKKQMAKK